MRMIGGLGIGLACNAFRLGPAERWHLRRWGLCPRAILTAALRGLFFALATRPVSTSSKAYARSPNTPQPVAVASANLSPCMDFTGNLHNSNTEPIMAGRPLVCAWEFTAKT